VRVRIMSAVMSACLFIVIPLGGFWLC